MERALCNIGPSLHTGPLLWKVDNTVAHWAILNQGSNRSPALCRLAVKILKRTKSLQIYIEPVRLSSEENLLADCASRSGSVADWSLKESIAKKIFRRWGIPDIDLMATERSRKAPRYISWNKGDKDAVALDSLSSVVKWNIWDLPYLFPPFSLVGRCLQKIREQEVERIIVVLQWNHISPHFGTALGMCLVPPVRLDHRKDMIVDLMTGQIPKGWKKRPMIACLLSGKQINSLRYEDGTERAATELRRLHQV